MKYMSVKELAEKLSKNEETIKRWIRNGRFPNAVKVSDKKGWQIPLSDLEKDFGNTLPLPDSDVSSSNYQFEGNIRELVQLAYQATTLTYPSEEIITILEFIGIKRTLEILLIMNQSPKKVKNPKGFIRKAIQECWTPETVALSLPKKNKISLADLNNEQYEKLMQGRASENTKVPFYNWLEEE